MPASQLTLRNFDPAADFERLLELLRAAAEADRDGHEVDPERERRFLELEEHNPHSDRWVVEHVSRPGQMLGFGMIWGLPKKPAQLQIVVHPEWRRRGIGSTLLAALRSRAESLAAPSLGMNAYGSNQSAAAFLRAHGFSVQGRYSHLLGSLRPRFPQPDWPAGWSIRHGDAQLSPQTVVEGFNRAYAGLWGHRDTSLAQVSDWLKEWNPRDFILAYDPRERLAGMCRTDSQPETGYIDAPGLVQAWRQPELYQMLLLEALAYLQACGKQTVELESWGDPPEVLARYEMLGLLPVEQVDAWQRRL